jgi:hypothetical protein
MTNDSVRRPVGSCWIAVALIIVGLLTPACGSRGVTAPSPAQVAGVWLGEQTIASLTGGECLAGPLEDLVGLPGQFHATITQSGTSITATLDIDHTGAVCTYTGIVSGDSIDLHATACTPSKQLALQCSSGDLRDVRQVSEVVHGTVQGSTIAGVAVETDNVLVSGTTTSIGPLIFSTTITLTRQ